MNINYSDMGVFEFTQTMQEFIPKRIKGEVSIHVENPLSITIHWEWVAGKWGDKASHILRLNCVHFQNGEADKYLKDAKKSIKHTIERGEQR